jgi:hypothetical protein
MKAPTFAILIAFVLLQSCDFKPRNQLKKDTLRVEAAAPSATEREFAAIVNGLPVIDLPRLLGYWIGDVPSATNPNTLSWQEQYFKTYLKNPWGRVYVAQPNIHLLATQPDDQGTVFLLTFSTSGELIAEESLQRGHYVSADLQWATSNYSTLYPNMTLIEIDSLFRYPYDEAENDRLDGDEMCKVTRHEYIINPDGSLKNLRYDTTAFFKAGDGN